MVKDIVEIAGILAQPDLEDETKQAINAYIRDQIKAMGKEEKQPNAPMGVPNADVLREWLFGAEGGEAN